MGKSINTAIATSISDKVRIVEAYKKNPNGVLSVKQTDSGFRLIFNPADAKRAIAHTPVADLYKGIQGDSFLFTNQLEDFSMGSFLAQLAYSVNRIPKAADGFELIYRENPNYYYQNAVLDEYYQSNIINDGDLRTDIAKRRAYSVLLAAESDVELQNRICEVFYSIYPSVRENVSSLNIELIEELEAPNNLPISNILLHIFSYLILKKHGNRSDSLVFNAIISWVKEEDNDCDRYKDGYASFEQKAVALGNDAFKFIDFENEGVWKTIKNIHSFEDLRAFSEWWNAYAFNMEPKSGASLKARQIIEHESEKEDSLYGLVQAATIMQWFALIANIKGVNTSEFFANRTISIEEHKYLLEIIGYYYSQSKRGVKATVTINVYLTALLSYLIMDKIADGKELYFQNSNETMYSHIGALEARISELSDAIKELENTVSTKDEEITILRKEISALSSTVSKEAKELLKPQMDENAQLRKQIRELENKLHAEESKSTELNLLREFSFDIKSNYEAKETVALGSIIESKKIIVIGGHINWRNNLKKKYPAIQIYDGHVETVDLKPLETADFVFLNVSNMSHGMYYKVIDVLRKGDVPFDYLGRTINQELYEKEMADILQKRKFHL